MADKVAAAQAPVAELMTFTSELRAAAAALELHRPDGACDDTCGCVSSTNDVPPTIQAVSLTTKPGPLDIACTLSAGSIKARLEDWQKLLTHVVGRSAVDGGVRCQFAAHVPLASCCGSLLRSRTAASSSTSPSPSTPVVSPSR